MATIKVEVKNQIDVGKKPRVYFTCHPEDFEKHFKKICDDIFKTHDCAIYYTEDMMEAIPEAEKETDLGRNNLFVIPVTFKLLSTPNRAMEDFRYAMEHHIPVLPIMMETGLDSLYALPKNFGELQYLNPYSTDTTEISYEEKLKKHLDSILISDETAKRVRAAFDAYIFLSYRKKDRVYANQLMKLIHASPECRDIAIWFDEFLTPGESFRESIDKILHDSKLFTLLVTPNLLEEPNGKPNFVMGEEYPAAKKSGISILPAEMVETDKVALKEKFIDIPECVKPEDAFFYNQFIASISKIATEANNTPEHNFLIGLAYLDGIDVEVNRKFALELITSAAESGLPEAMEKLFEMYMGGIGVQLDYRKAVIWAEKYADYMVEAYGEENEETLNVLNALAFTYQKYGTYQKALELNKEVYKSRCKTLGEEHKDTLISLNNLAIAYGDIGEYKKELELNEKVYHLRCKTLGEEHPDTLTSLNNLAYAYGKSGNYKKNLKLIEKSYKLSCKILGEEHPDTLMSLNNIACTYDKFGEHKKALELNEKAYNLRYKVLGGEHPDTLMSLINIAATYDFLENYIKALECSENGYNICCEALGEKHPFTLAVSNNLAHSYNNLGKHKKAFHLAEKNYYLCCKVLGEKHPDTLITLSTLAYTCDKLGNLQKSLKLKEKVYKLSCEVLGEEHPDTLIIANELAITYNKLREFNKALELSEKTHRIARKVLGKNHAITTESAQRIEVLKIMLKK